MNEILPSIFTTQIVSIQQELDKLELIIKENIEKPKSTK